MTHHLRTSVGATPQEPQAWQVLLRCQTSSREISVGLEVSEGPTVIRVCFGVCVCILLRKQFVFISPPPNLLGFMMWPSFND